MKNLSIEEKNKSFSKLSKAKQRVEIAKDVLKQLKSGYIKATSGIYVQSKNLKNMPGLLNSEVEIKDILDKDKSCKACGIGSMLVCAVKRFDKLKVKDLSSANYYNIDITQSDVLEYLERWFSDLELAKIESAFEKSVGLGNVYRNSYSKQIKADKEIDKAYYYFFSSVGKRLSAKARLKAIMNNIIRNNGTFNVSKKYGER